MTRRRMWPSVVGVVAVTGLVVAGCTSSSDNGGDATTTASSPGNGGDPTTTTVPAVPTPPDESKVGRPTVQGPITTGKGSAVLGQAGFDLATVGYDESEFFLSGQATTYTASAPLGSDGRWSVEPGSLADYTTRIVVRKPTDPAAFDGTVFVEWLNVSGGLDAAPDWSYAHVEMIREGAAWVGVSAQKAGLDGTGNALGAALAPLNVDPVRYEPVNHPGDDYSYDMFSQAGASVWFDSGEVLEGLTPQRVIAVGESQSAFRLSTYVNAVAPLNDVYDGYLVHSRASFGAPLVTDVPAPEPTLTRTDLAVPVLTVSSETDVVGDRLGYSRARQPDTDRFRSWEIPGTAHADAYNLGISDADDGSGASDAELFRAMRTPPASLFGGFIVCDTPINTGPHTYVLRSAVAALDRWVRTGETPPEMPPIELDGSGAIVRDGDGNALGGIRTPQLDVPVATLSGVGQTGSGFCGLFGTTKPFGAEQLRADQPTHAEFVAAWKTALDDAVERGAILAADAEVLQQVAETSSIPN